jgi:hypothetical protein
MHDWAARIDADSASGEGFRLNLTVGIGPTWRQ